MVFENKQWDTADQNLTSWLNGDNTHGFTQLSDILKSIYLAFRQKEVERLSHFFKKAFEYYQEQERKREKESLEDLLKIDFGVIEEEELGYDRSMFRRVSRSLDHFVLWTREENEEIIEGIITGNQEVFNNLYEYEFPKVVSLIIKNSGCVEMAQDVFQDAIVILMEKVYNQKLDLTCSVKTYLYSICKYLWLDQLRQNKKEELMIKFYDKECTPEDISVHFYNTPDIFDHVAAAIDVLGDPCKQLLECFYYKNMSWDEIASSLGYANAASARNQKYKCLEKIRNIVNVEVE